MVAPGAFPARRPAVWVNCAASLDGRLALAGGLRARFSSTEDLVRVQKLRAHADAILIGVGTVIKDDPSLRVHWELLGEPPGRNPTRVIVDASGRTPENARVLDGSAPTILATSERSHRTFPPTVHTIVVGKEKVDFGELFPLLYELGIRRLMVEGGAEILSSVLRARLFDRFTIYYAPVVVGGATAPPVVSGLETHRPEEEIEMDLVGLEPMGEGFVATYVPRKISSTLPPAPSETGAVTPRSDKT
ncbi:MAG TPA: dihydrofolate reductase family protein [Thermoplasmata archaeon]|nr:dihydrofolate reductase family protein [Thermoplasmata archaeon]